MPLPGIFFVWLYLISAQHETFRSFPKETERERKGKPRKAHQLDMRACTARWCVAQRTHTHTRDTER